MIMFSSILSRYEAVEFSQLEAAEPSWAQTRISGGSSRKIECWPKCEKAPSPVANGALMLLRLQLEADLEMFQFSSGRRLRLAVAEPAPR